MKEYLIDSVVNFGEYKGLTILQIALMHDIEVKNADFEIEDKFRPGLGKWIDQFTYYSCDGISGYLIMETKGKEYMHEGLPLSKWKELKNAESAGSYYVKQIKGNYRLQPR